MPMLFRSNKFYLRYSFKIKYDSIKRIKVPRQELENSSWKMFYWRESSCDLLRIYERNLIFYQGGLKFMSISEESFLSS